MYQPDEVVRLEVRLEDDTVWLTQAQMAELFGVKEHTITYHLKGIYNSEELEPYSTTRKNRVVRFEGGRTVARHIDFYNLDAIISVGYRVNSKRGIQFRQWSTKILKEYLLKGYAMKLSTQQIEEHLHRHDKEIGALTEKIDFFVRTSLPPVEGIFYNGQIFDAYAFAADLIQYAHRRLILIDNYIDTSTLLLLGKSKEGVQVTVYTAKLTARQQLDVDRYNSQYAPVVIKECVNVHDRFLVVDDVVYHIGASLKDLGKKLFAFSKMGISVDEVLSMLS